MRDSHVSTCGGENYFSWKTHLQRNSYNFCHKFCGVMGATASLATALPENMDETQLHSICQKRFNQALFDENCNENKMLSRERFIELVVLQQENEVKEFFTQFALTREGKKTDQITCEQLLGLCMHSKMFSKNRFSSQNCADLFVELSENPENKDRVTTEVVMDSNSSIKKIVTIDFHVFRNEFLPSVAGRKQISVDKLVFKLSRCEAATIQVNNNYVVDDDYDPEKLEEPSVNVYVQALAHRVRLKRQLSCNNKFKRRSDMTDGEVVAENSAASHIQTQERIRQARHIVSTMRKINYSSFHCDPLNDFDHLTYEEAMEEALKEKFLQYANRCHELDWKGFVKMCGDEGLYGQKFTKQDARYAFELGMARGEWCSVLLRMSTRSNSTMLQLAVPTWTLSST